MFRNLSFLGVLVFTQKSAQPIKRMLLTDSLEPTNEWYAIAKISGVKLGGTKKQYNRNYLSLMPTISMDLEIILTCKLHVLPAMIRKFHEAKINNRDVVLWAMASL